MFLSILTFAVLQFDKKSVNKPHDRGGQKRSIAVIYHPVFPENICEKYPSWIYKAVRMLPFKCFHLSVFISHAHMDKIVFTPLLMTEKQFRIISVTFVGFFP